MTTTPPQRVPENVPGDFYVVRGLCTRCCLPHSEAPELLNDPHVEFRECYFRRQPRNDAEVEHAVRAMAVSCVEALRYAGNDPKIIARLAELRGPNARAAWGRTPCEPATRRPWWQRLFGGAG